MKSKLKVYILLPYIRTLNGITIGKFQFKGNTEFQNESPEIQDELKRIISFFRQKGALTIDGFNYLILEKTKNQLDKLFIEIRRNIEIFRYLTLDPERKGLNSEHTTPYIIFPRSENPWKQNNEDRYMYRISEGFTGREYSPVFPHTSRRPIFYKDIYTSNPPYIEDKLMNKLIKALSDKDLQAITWYNKTFSSTSIDDKENLLRLSVSFESYFSFDEKEGKDIAISLIEDEIKLKFKKDSELLEKLKIVKPYVNSLIVRRLAEAVKNITESDSIKKWFKRHFYTVGSGIRHGDEVSELPTAVISKSKQKKSIWYAGDATHEYLNNVYFGQRLFKLLLEEKYYPFNKYVMKLKVENLEGLLVSDEERLKKLEEMLLCKDIGNLEAEDLRIVFSFRGTFYGSNERIFTLLKRILNEVQTDTETWSKISKPAALILKTNLKEKDFTNYKKNKKIFDALIDIDSTFYNSKPSSVVDDNDMKAFYIREFISYAIHRLV